MTFTDRQRERAYGLFADGFSTQQVASRLRVPVNSVRSLRAHWTMSNNAPAIRRSTSASSSSSSSITKITLSRSQARRVARAYENGETVTLSIGS